MPLERPRRSGSPGLRYPLIIPAEWRCCEREDPASVLLIWEGKADVVTLIWIVFINLGRLRLFQVTLELPQAFRSSRAHVTARGTPYSVHEARYRAPVYDVFVSSYRKSKRPTGTTTFLSSS